MQLRVGALLQDGKYRIEGLLGQGGFGITYLAVQTGLNRKVAIKEFIFLVELDFLNGKERLEKIAPVKSIIHL